LFIQSVRVLFPREEVGLIRYDAQQADHYRKRLLKEVETDVRDCYQCGNCSASCPAAFTFDYKPNQLMRMLQVGMVDQVLDSKAIQLCVQCLTCTGRCPRNIDIAGIFEDLKTIVSGQGRDVPEHAKTFNKAFMDAVARYGRLPELYMMGMFYLGTMSPKMAMGDAPLAVPMLAKGKMSILPHKAKGADEVGRIYKKAMAAAKAREKADSEGAAREAAAAAAAAQAKAAAAHAAHAAAPAKAGAGGEDEVAA
jgi:heterodisulfide reductase subunit C